MSKKILGISRSVRFSPNSASRDAAIFQAVAEQVGRLGMDVSLVSEDHFVSAEGYDAVFSMARDEQVLRRLAQAEDRGLLMVNSAKCLLKSTRLAMTELFEKADVPVPCSPAVFRLEGKEMRRKFRLGETCDWKYPVWLKRSGACAQAAGDVCFVENGEMLRAALDGYVQRGIDEVLMSEHLQGDLVKFYGVEDTGFFYSYYPTADNSFSKFGLEKINGAPSGYPLDVKSLKQCADRAAVICGIPVYGGDAIVDAEGSFRIIDFNDWPSYSRCCEEAAVAIAEKIAHLLSGEPGSSPENTHQSFGEGVRKKK